METFDVEIVGVFDETPMDRTFRIALQAKDRDRFAFRPGQFVLVRDPEAEKPRQRAYSFSSAPDGSGAFEVTVRETGGFAERFFDFEVGKHLEVSEPQGRFLLEAPAAATVILCAGGAGVAPYRGFVRYLRARGHGEPVALLHSVREPEQLLFRQELDRHDRECAWFRYVPTVTRCPPQATWEGRRGRIDRALLAEVMGEPASTILYAVGPTSFVEGAMRAAHAAGIPPDRVRREKWG